MTKCYVTAMHSNRFRLSANAMIALAALCACSPDYDPLTFSVEGDAIIATGAVDASALAAFDAVVAANPTHRTLVLRFVEGSVDDEANVILGRRVRALGFDTVVPADGLVASGGTDLFLAGISRRLEPGACVGVHAWAGPGFVATDLPRSDPEHARYTDYYGDLGIPEAFYWYTLEAAPAEGMHWMSGGEAAQYELVAAPGAALAAEQDCLARLGG